MKLSCHNFTLFDIVTQEAQNYFWHEGEGELNANIFATFVIDYLDSIDLTDVKEILIYSDGCTYQNRKTTIANALLLLATRNIKSTSKEVTRKWSVTVFTRVLNAK